MENNNNAFTTKKQIYLKDLLVQTLLMIIIINANIVVFFYQRGIFKPLAAFAFRFLFKCNVLLRDKYEENLKFRESVYFSTPKHPKSRILKHHFMENNISPIVNKGLHKWEPYNITGISL